MTEKGQDQEKKNSVSRQGQQDEVVREPQVISEETQISLSGLDLSKRVRRILEESGFRTVESLLDLLEYDPQMLLDIKGFGKKSLEEVQQRLREAGYRWESPEPAESETPESSEAELAELEALGVSSRGEAVALGLVGPAAGAAEEARSEVREVQEEPQREVERQRPWRSRGKIIGFDPEKEQGNILLENGEEALFTTGAILDGSIPRLDQEVECSIEETQRGPVAFDIEVVEATEAEEIEVPEADVPDFLRERLRQEREPDHEAGARASVDWSQAHRVGMPTSEELEALLAKRPEERREQEGPPVGPPEPPEEIPPGEPEPQPEPEVARPEAVEAPPSRPPMPPGPPEAPPPEEAGPEAAEVERVPGWWSAWGWIVAALIIGVLAIGTGGGLLLLRGYAPAPVVPVVMTATPSPVPPSATPYPTYTPYATFTPQPTVVVEKPVEKVVEKAVTVTAMPTPTAAPSPTPDQRVEQLVQDVRDLAAAFSGLTQIVSQTIAAQVQAAPAVQVAAPLTVTLESPVLFDADSCAPEVSRGCSFDVGVNPGQVGLAFGWHIAWPQGGLDVGGNGCDLVVLRQGWYENLVILDGRYEVYDVPQTDYEGWLEVLAVQRADEQSANYRCPSKRFADIPQWDSTSPSPPIAPTTTPTATPTRGPTPSPTPTTTVARIRRATGQNKSLTFQVGDSVYGWRIKLADSRTCDGGECWLPTTPLSGTVTSGVINPWPNEVPEKTKKNPWKP